MQGEQVDEHNSLAFVYTGAAGAVSLHEKSAAANFFHLKGDVEQLLAAFASEGVTYDRQVPAWLHPGRSARAVLNGKTLAVFGQLHPEVAAERKLKQPVLVAELFVEELYALSLRRPAYAAVSKYPAVERDFSLVLADTLEFDAIRHKLEALKITELIEVLPAEVFRGGSLAAGTYSLLLRVCFQSAERTLRDDEINLWSQQIVKSVEELGGTLRA
jgi:phenylalanyl-tRNA synthetase beta chain